MSDLSRHLPLSRRPRHDESAVSGDWSVPFAAALRHVAGALETADTEPSRAIAGRLLWRLGSGRLSRASALLAGRDGALEAASRPGGELAAELRALADSARRRGVGDLAVAVVGALDVDEADPTAAPAPVEATALGAVAIARALTAPLAIRAVVAGTTLVADDGDWRVGRGPAIHAPGASIVRFLYGRSGVPAERGDTIDDGTKERDMAEKSGGFDLGGLEGVVGNLFGGKHFDITALEPMWAQIQPFLRGLDADEIVDKVGSWAKELELPIVKQIPDETISKIQAGVRVPLANLIQR